MTSCDEDQEKELARPDQLLLEALDIHEADSLCSAVQSIVADKSLLPGESKMLSDFYQVFVALEANPPQITLSRAQEKSFWILWQWWSSYRSICEVPADKPRSNYVRLRLNGRTYELNINSRHFKAMSNFFQDEFSTRALRTTRGQRAALRQEAANISARHYVALYGYRQVLERADLKIRDLDPADHKAMLALPWPLVPRSPDGRMILGEKHLAGLHPRCATGATLVACNWLPESDELPYYLWDRHESQVVVVSKLAERPEYTAISHTWGRWKLQGAAPARVAGVYDWRIPQNEIFEVRDLPAILKQVPTSTRYIWFDLVCIPQDGSPKADEEIARQAIIFQNANHSIIWFNRTYDWSGLHSAIEYMSLVFLDVDLEDHPHGNLPTKLFEEYDFHPGILREHMEPVGWFSSLWTLQEICLRPDSWLCNANWELFAVREGGYPVAMDTLITLTQECTQILDRRAFLRASDDPSEVRPLFNADMDNIEPNKRFGLLAAHQHLPREYLELTELFDRIGMNASKTSQFIRRDVILSLGSQRYCQDLRAEAIMSVLGTTKWREKMDPDTSQLVLGQYPLCFVQDVAKEIGAHFYNSISVNANKLSSEYAKSACTQGSLMPFQSGQPGCESKIVLDWVFKEDEVENKTVSTWEIQHDGSVVVARAAILASTQRSCGKVDADVWFTYDAPEREDTKFRDPRGRSKRVDLIKLLQTYFPFSDNYAVELGRPRLDDAFFKHAHPGSRGILLKESYPGSRRMLKIGNFLTAKELRSPWNEVIEEDVNWIVL